MSSPRRRPRTEIDIHQPRYSLGEDLQSELDGALRDWRVNDKVRRLWARDSTLWSGSDEAKWLGWLDITERQLAHLDLFDDFAADVRDGGFTHVLLLGMGGSSLCPEVLSETFGQQEGSPRLYVLDSTDPAQVKAFEHKLDLGKTLFIVSSKSGSTLEPNIFKQYFFERLEQTLGKGKAGAHFAAVTDPGSKLEEAARRDGFRQIFHGDPSIGGRYSALSHFGMIPAAAMGIEVRRFLERADEMAIACSPRVPVKRNPGLVLGLILGAAAKAGRDKLTLITSPGLSNLGAWLEQLLAESTGKQGRGIIPVDREPLGSPEDYGNDRVFAYLSVEGQTDAQQDAAIETLEKAGRPVVRLHLRDAYDLGAQFFLWEIATAVAGSVLGINPFDQPDVEASKIVSRTMTEQYESSGTLPVETAFARFDRMAFFADGTNAAALQAGGGATSTGLIKAHLSRLAEGDYFALLGYVEMKAEHERILEGIRRMVRASKKVATCAGFGPRFLHSTGQAYKGGPNSGVFLQITCDDAADLDVPGRKYTFGVVKAAQASGDFQVLTERGRRALRVHLSGDATTALSRLGEVIREALG
ncbi:MAG: bifunctional transaldolase/phosoglucose isomerase [Bryobacterales bacterium]|nr:bifunctional transaldolase/phosoglucose isomerase [Bryobacterales bacterium]MDE0295063.1 bifunctional transaldolase/phosoglucose isomerase [Bryobacterales bacterium]